MIKSGAEQKEKSALLVCIGPKVWFRLIVKVLFGFQLSGSGYRRNGMFVRFIQKV